MKVDPLVVRFGSLLLEEGLEGPVLDLACGQGQNGLYLAELGLPVVLADKSRVALEAAQAEAAQRGLAVTLWEVDLESGGCVLPEEHYRGILVFHYLHRPLIPCIRQAVRRGGVLLYETFTVAQREFGRPRNPDFLLNPGELAGWFRDWHVIHHFEGYLEEPRRAVAQLVCRKPAE